MTSPSYFVPPPPPPRAPRRHALLAALSLAILSIVVVAPLALALLLLAGSILVFVGAGALRWVGVSNEGALHDAAAIASILIGATILLAVADKLDVYFRRPPSGLPGATPRPTRLPWVARHPWLAAASLALFVDACLVPLDGAHVIDLPSTLLAVGVFMGGALLVILTAYTIQTAWWTAVRALFAGARRSSFFAGAITTGSLLTTAIALLFASAVPRPANALANAAVRSALPACDGDSLVDCSHTILGGSYGQAGAGALTPIGVSGLPEAPSSFDACIEELHTAPPGQRSAREDGIEQARRFTQDRAEAEDVVQATMIAVCAGSERIIGIRPYFFRSLQNAALRSSARRRRFCPSSFDEPGLEPVGCIAESLRVGVMQERMERAALDALCELTPDESAVIKLHLVEDLSHAEIARRLGCSEQAARQRYSRAMKALRERFQRRCD